MSSFLVKVLGRLDRESDFAFSLAVGTADFAQPFAGGAIGGRDPARFFSGAVAVPTLYDTFAFAVWTGLRHFGDLVKVV